jgi:hypothetical protein
VYRAAYATGPHRSSARHPIPLGVGRSTPCLAQVPDYDTPGVLSRRMAALAHTYIKLVETKIRDGHSMDIIIYVPGTDGQLELSPGARASVW